MGRLRKKAFFRSVTSNVIMDFRAKVEQLVHEFIETRKDLYLVDLKISAGDDITVILDGDEGLSLQDCLDASRAVEFNLDSLLVVNQLNGLMRQPCQHIAHGSAIDRMHPGWRNFK